MADEHVDKLRAPLLGSPHKFKLALFGVNVRAGLVMSTYENVPQATWEESVRLARKCDEIGIEALIPLARWHGYSSKGTGARGFESFTWAAGIAAVTERLQVFATFHVPTVHPVLGAKMVSTIDHISGGRFGLNLVAGWQPQEVAMFGTQQRDHDERYKVADEWIELAKRMWSEEGMFDYDGEYYTVPNAFLEPKPLQQPYPLLMSAGISPAGRAFAAKNTDLVFAAIEDASQTAQIVADLKELARSEHGKELLVFAHGHICCGDTEAEAQALYDEVYHQKGDWEAGKNVLGMLMGHSQSVDWESFETQRLLESTIRGYFAFPMTGAPEQIVAMMVDFADAGLDGLAISLPDNDAGLDRMGRQIMPLMAEAGLRASAPAAGAAA